MTYTLAKEIVGKHEHNIGPSPSGYAYLRIKLRPVIEKEGIILLSPPDSIWRIRSTQESENIDPDRAERLIDSYKSMIMKGVTEGARQGLQDSLDQPVTNVEVLIEEVVFDIMYSTEAAFHYVSLDMVKRMLWEAYEKGCLTIIN